VPCEWAVIIVVSLRLRRDVRRKVQHSATASKVYTPQVIIEQGLAISFHDGDETSIPAQMMPLFGGHQMYRVLLSNGIAAGLSSMTSPRSPLSIASGNAPPIITNYSLDALIPAFPMDKPFS
jgi:hypothetical protein